MEKNKKHFSKEMAFLYAMIINSAAVALLIKSDFGVSTLSSLPLVLSGIFPQISIGMMNALGQSALLIIMICITRQPRITYLFSFLIAFLFGLLQDIFLALFGYLPDLFLLRIVYFFAGWVMICFGAALFIRSGMPLMPFDCVVRDLSLFWNTRVRNVKMGVDLLFVGGAVVLSLVFMHKLYGAGIGTIFMAFFNGGLTQHFVDWIDAHLDMKCFTKAGAFLNRIAAISPKKV